MILNGKHKRIYNFIKGYTSSNGYAPTIREIGRYVGMNSASGVHYILKKLESDGVIKRSREWRGIVVLKDAA